MIKLRLFLLSSWLGAAVFFSFVVAPAVFSTLRAFTLPNANEIAGTIVTHSLSVVNVAGVVTGVALLGMNFIGRRNERGLTNFLTSVAFVVLALATGIGHWVIAAKMRALRASMVVIDQVPLEDARRIAFNNLHHYSVLALGTAMCAAAIAILLIRTRSVR